MSDEEWGPWIVHDGTGCPLKPGQFVHVEYYRAQYVGPILPGHETDPRGWTCEFCEGTGYGDSWIWDSPGPFRPVIRYRIRKPRGLLILEERLRNLPQPEEVAA